MLAPGLSSSRVFQPRKGDRMCYLFSISYFRPLSPPRGFLCCCIITRGLTPPPVFFRLFETLTSPIFCFLSETLMDKSVGDKRRLMLMSLSPNCLMQTEVTLFHRFNHRLDKLDFFVRQAVLRIKVGIGPRTREVLEGDKTKNSTETILC